jgi:hypothetical protein
MNFQPGRRAIYEGCHTEPTLWRTGKRILLPVTTGKIRYSSVGRVNGIVMPANPATNLLSTYTNQGTSAVCVCPSAAATDVQPSAPPGFVTPGNTRPRYGKSLWNSSHYSGLNLERAYRNHSNTLCRLSIGSWNVRPTITASRYTLYNKNQALEIFRVPYWKWCKRTAGVIFPVIRNLLVFVRIWLFYISHMIHARRLLNTDTNVSAQFEEKHGFVLMTLPNPPKAKQSWKLFLRFVAHVPS